MKRMFKIYSLMAVTFVFTAITSCEDRLDEQPRSVLVPDFFRTGQGLRSGITAAYASFREFYGNEGAMNMLVYGTDEFTHGQQVNNPAFNTYNSSLNSQAGDLGAAWNNAYRAINTCNGIIDIGPSATGLNETEKNALIAEAKFIRAQWYFTLVQFFGGVTLDLGSGPLKFNTSTENFASRATLADTYQAIINDLENITDGQNNDDLPNARPAAGMAGQAWKASALHLLAKVYLTRGWSSAAQAGDFQKAYDKALELINNKATYGVDLLANYSDIHRQGNEWNNETLWQVNWIDNTTFNNNTAFGGPNYQNRSLFFFRSFYESETPGLVRSIEYGRPWTRYTPTRYLHHVAFADKVNDTRYNKSFQTVWYVNSPGTRNPKGLAMGDTAVWMVPQHLAASVEPTIASRRYVVFTPTMSTDPKVYFNNPGLPVTVTAHYIGYNLQNKYYPTLTKFNSTQARPGNDVNITSVRPFIVYRFAETYLIAAEAALKLGRPAQEVADLINKVRERAAAGGGNIAAMTSSTADSVSTRGVDFILNERTRELAGEQLRWFDLVRTGKLIERVKKYNNYSPGFANSGSTVVPQDYAAMYIQDKHVLRPIPQSQIDASVDPTSEGGKYPQNPGY